MKLTAIELKKIGDEIVIVRIYRDDTNLVRNNGIETGSYAEMKMIARKLAKAANVPFRDAVALSN